MIASGAMAVSVAYIAADFRALSRHCKSCRRRLLVLALIPLGISLVSLRLEDGGLETATTLAGSIVLGVLLAGAVYWLSPIYQIWIRRRNGWDTPVEIALGESSVVAKHPTQNSEYFWSSIKGVSFASDRLFIFTTPYCAIILPRRIFASAEEFDGWIRTARERLKTATSSEPQP